MKKTLKLIALGILAGQMAFAGGIVTNTNQSAMWVRMLSRDASTDIDAVYYNPAGVIELGEGMHFSLSNQSIFQEYTLTSTYPTLKGDTYIGDVSAPIYPNIYASYNKEKWAASFGFEIIGGGGSAQYNTGMPSFENEISALPSLITGKIGIPTTGYSVNQYFDGTSIFYGFQAGFAYKINKIISASVGFRYVFGHNRYTGYLKDAMINPTYPAAGMDGSYIRAEDFFNTLSSVNPDPSLPVYAAKVGDKYVGTTQTAHGIAPIISVNITPTEALNIAVKWEGKTSLEFKNDTKLDDINMFPDGAKTNRDMPMMLSIGAQYQITDDFRAQIGYHLFNDKGANWDGREDRVDNNFFEISIGAEYDLSEMITVSAGYLKGTTGVAENYQDNLSFSLSSTTMGLGAKLNLNEQWSLDLGVAKMMYVDSNENEVAVVADAAQGISASPAYSTNYDKEGFMFAVGINYNIF